MSRQANSQTDRWRNGLALRRRRQVSYSTIYGRLIALGFIVWVRSARLFPSQRIQLACRDPRRMRCDASRGPGSAHVDRQACLSAKPTSAAEHRDGQEAGSACRRCWCSDGQLRCTRLEGASRRGLRSQVVCPYMLGTCLMTALALLLCYSRVSPDWYVGPSMAPPHPADDDPARRLRRPMQTRWTLRRQRTHRTGPTWTVGSDRSRRSAVPGIALPLFHSSVV
jgi:hypothetical protein